MSKSYVLALSDQGARYVPIESNMLLSKRKRDDLSSIEPPQHVRLLLSLFSLPAPHAICDVTMCLQVDVLHRELSAEEQAQHKQRIGALYGFDMQHDEQETAGGGSLGQDIE